MDRFRASLEEEFRYLQAAILGIAGLLLSTRITVPRTRPALAYHFRRGRPIIPEITHESETIEMTQNSDTYDETAPAVDYELISGDTERAIKVPQRKVPAGSIVLPRPVFYILLGFSAVGLVAGVMLVSAVLAFVR